MKALQLAHSKDKLIVGLCLGAFVLGDAGLLDGKEATTRKKGLIGAALGMAVPFALRAAQGSALKYLEQWMLQQQVNAMHAGPAPASSGAQARPGSRSNRPSGPRPGPGMD